MAASFCWEAPMTLPALVFLKWSFKKMARNMRFFNKLNQHKTNYYGGITRTTQKE